MRINHEEILGYYVGDDLYCSDCIISEKIEIEDPEAILFEKEAESKKALYFCDCCKNRLW